MSDSILIPALNQELFHTWLSSKDGDTVVGRAGDPSCCPISTYLKETFPQYKPAVGVETVKLSSRDGIVERVNHAGWSAQFVRQIDTINGWTQVKAATALSVLQGIMPQHNNPDGENNG